MAITHKAIPLMNGANLNFNVVGDTFPPENPKDNTIWVNTANSIHHWSLNGKEPYRKSNNKNLFTYPYVDTTKTVNGITFTDNGDGSITINGKPTGNAEFVLNRLLLDKNTTYALKGTGQEYVGVHLAEYKSNSWIQTPHKAIVNDISFTYAGLQDNTANLKCVIYIGLSENTFNNVVVYPQLEKGNACTNFVKGDATGQVWIKTIDSKGFISFNALKKNTIDTHLSRVKQWNGKKWKNMSGIIYPKDMSPLIYKATPDYIYNAGDTCDDLTGGWSAHTTLYAGRDGYGDRKIHSWPHGPEGAAAFNNSNVFIGYYGSWGGIMINTAKPINFADEGIKSLTINCTTTISGWGYGDQKWDRGLTYANWIIALVPTITDGQTFTRYYEHDYGNWYIDGESTAARTEAFSKTLTDLDTLSGSYYVVVGLFRTVPAAFNMTVNSIETHPRSEDQMGSVILTNLIGDELKTHRVDIDSAYAIRDARVSRPVQANHRYFVLWEGGNWGGAYTSVNEGMIIGFYGENYQELFSVSGKFSQKSLIVEAPADGVLAMVASSHCATEPGTSSGIYCNAYMLVDLTEIELARGKQFASAEEFWSFIGSSVFYGAKEFNTI